MGYYCGKLDAGVPRRDVMATILGSDEYMKLAGSSAPGFVSKLIQDLAGRAPVLGEVTRWEAQYVWADGSNRAKCAMDMLISFGVQS